MFGKAVRLSREGVLMTPRTTDTDGFFASVLRRGGWRGAPADFI